MNLTWAIEKVLNAIAGSEPDLQKNVQKKIEIALRTATAIAEQDAEHCRMIGQHGLNLIEEIAREKNGKQINILTHCNAGWLTLSIMDRRWHQFTPRTIAGYRSTFGSMRPDHAARDPSSRRGSLVNTVCPIPSSRIARADI